MKKIRLKKKVKKTIIKTILIIIAIIILSEGGNYLYQTTKKLTPIENHNEEYYHSYDFGYILEKSTTDYNKNGIDDYTDILNGVKKVAQTNPKYVNKYYAGGYPPENEAISTDLIVSSLKEAGYYLKDLISKDIIQTTKNKKNTYNIEIRDDNIDFRRINNQTIFFDRYFENLSVEEIKVGTYQAGDIIVFDYNSHVAIVSDKYNKNATPYIIHIYNDKQKQKEEDILETIDMTITGHYRVTYNEKLEKILSS
jgi:uncharacterized protein